METRRLFINPKTSHKQCEAVRPPRRLTIPTFPARFRIPIRPSGRQSPSNITSLGMDDNSLIFLSPLCSCLNSSHRSQRAKFLSLHESLLPVASQIHQIKPCFSSCCTLGLRGTRTRKKTTKSCRRRRRVKLSAMG